MSLLDKFCDTADQILSDILTNFPEWSECEVPYDFSVHVLRETSSSLQSSKLVRQIEEGDMVLRRLIGEQPKFSEDTQYRVKWNGNIDQKMLNFFLIGNLVIDHGNRGFDFLVIHQELDRVTRTGESRRMLNTIIDYGFNLNHYDTRIFLISSCLEHLWQIYGKTGDPIRSFTGDFRENYQKRLKLLEVISIPPSRVKRAQRKRGYTDKGSRASHQAQLRRQVREEIAREEREILFWISELKMIIRGVHPRQSEGVRLLEVLDESVEGIANCCIANPRLRDLVPVDLWSLVTSQGRWSQLEA